MSLPAFAAVGFAPASPGLGFGLERAGEAWKRPERTRRNVPQARARKTRESCKRFTCILMAVNPPFTVKGLVSYCPGMPDLTLGREVIDDYGGRTGRPSGRSNSGRGWSVSDPGAALFRNSGPPRARLFDA